MLKNSLATLALVIGVMADAFAGQVASTAQTQSVQLVDWCEASLPLTIQSGGLMEVKLTVKGIQATKLGVKLRHKKSGGSYCADYATTEPQSVTTEGPYVFRFDIGQEKGLESVSPVVFLSPTGKWEDRTSEVMAYDIYLNTTASGISEKLPVNVKYDQKWDKKGESAWSWNTPQAKINPSGDLEWAPEPFVLKVGESVRYVDYENGNDENSGTSTGLAWKHHPWDSNSSAVHAAKSVGVDTYIFKRGVIYRGALVAAQSGKQGLPIRLTSDPTWGTGAASLYGSDRIGSVWKRLGNDELTGAPARELIWVTELLTDAIPRSMWEIRDGKALPIRLARFPNWTWSQPNNIRAEWSQWEKGATESNENFICNDGRLAAIPTDALKGATLFSEPIWPGLGLAPYPFPVAGNIGSELSIPPNRILTKQKHYPGTGSRYFIENAPALLDEPGEFWFDTNTRRIYVRLPGDQDPNLSVIEAAIRPNMISLGNKSHIEISGLEFRFDNPRDFLAKSWAEDYIKTGCIVLNGDCVDISLRNCRFEDICLALGAWAAPHDIQDRLFVADNDVKNAERGAFHTRVLNLIRVKIMRNRIQNAGLGRCPRYELGHAIAIRYPRLSEIAGNIIQDAGCSGIYVEGGRDGHYAQFFDAPLVRTIIHHNKVVNGMQTTTDYGNISSWQLGPTYIYNNVSGNPLGLDAGVRAPRDIWNRKDTYISSTFAYAYYLDGAFKNYLFNNIAWGTSNDFNSSFCNAAGMMDIFGLNHTIFNNTYYRFGAGLRRQLSVPTQFLTDGMFPLKCVYTGNLWVDISDVFLDLDASANKPRDPGKDTVDYGTLYLTRNAFAGNSRSFGATEWREVTGDGRGRFKTFSEFQKEMKERKSVQTDIGVLCEEKVLEDPAKHDFRPSKDSEPIAGLGAYTFVPWGLYGVVGEWNFHPFVDGSDPVVFGQSMYFTEEYYHRLQYHLVPDNSLVCSGVNQQNFVMGPLENWIPDALEFNGTNAFCILNDADIKKSMDYKGSGFPERHYDGAKRKSLDMGTNNFLIEIVFRPEFTDLDKISVLDKTSEMLGNLLQTISPGKQEYSGSVLIEKAAEAGYRLRIDEGNRIALDMIAPGFRFSGITRDGLKSGRWYHFIVEIDRKTSEGIRMYLDGSEVPVETSGVWPEFNASLANTGDFYVARGVAGNYFRGAIDFLRVARGTLADAQTSIAELYEWEFRGPMKRDFNGKEAETGERTAGAINATEASESTGNMPSTILSPPPL